MQIAFSRENLEAYSDLDKKGYKKFRNLRRVLDRLRSQIEEITVMRLDHEGKRVGRFPVNLPSRWIRKSGASAP